MSLDALPAFVDPQRRAPDHESLLLADSLRNARLTLLYARAGEARDALLADGVVPLLARRAADGSRRPRSTPDVADFVERRGGAFARQRERVVYISAWQPDPLGALDAALRSLVPGGVSQGAERLADLLESVCARLDARLLVVLDAFEDFLALDPRDAAAAPFGRALADAVARPHLPVHVLLVVDDRFEGRLDGLRRTIPGFDDSTIRLLGFEFRAATRGGRRGRPGSPALPTLHDAVAPRAAPPSAPPPSRPARAPKVAPPAPIRTDTVYALIESTLALTADGSPPWHAVECAAPAPADVPRSGHGRDVVDAALPTVRPVWARSDLGVTEDRPVPGGRDCAASRDVPPGGTGSARSPRLDAALAWCRRRLRPG